jgi:hypothetical protein
LDRSTSAHLGFSQRDDIQTSKVCFYFILIHAKFLIPVADIAICDVPGNRRYALIKLFALLFPLCTLFMQTSKPSHFLVHLIHKVRGRRSDLRVPIANVCSC